MGAPIAIFCTVTPGRAANVPSEVADLQTRFQAKEVDEFEAVAKPRALMRWSQADPGFLKP